MGDGDFYRKLGRRSNLQAALKRLLANRRLMLGLVLGIPLALFVLFGNRGVVQRVRLQAQKADLEQKILEAEAEAKRLQQESRALDGDRKTIEKVAREKYGMVREGETVYRVARSR
jgi:cell division protein FtsB